VMISFAARVEQPLDIVGLEVVEERSEAGTRCLSHVSHGCGAPSCVLENRQHAAGTRRVHEPDTAPTSEAQVSTRSVTPLSGHSFAHDVRELDDGVQLDPVVRYVARVLEVEEPDTLHGGGALELPVLER
jgi:hypothetical protein